MKRKIEIDKTVRQKMIEDIKQFFEKELEQEIGDLSATMVLDFVINNLAGHFYNKGIRDCIGIMHEKVEDLYGNEI